ncbi:hypothetical protein FXN61_12645 [Lentzea sp. PSKA42]|uniref:DUF3558 domain-containing protein n=1 Tax=Lentzea indica TaxID=2604800 RepID=A0ABX1FFB9_9PSEU|nr:hypothetical protein [Lentzea indica]NKE57638.1 hypothetical protein [Lentzea indica]
MDGARKLADVREWNRNGRAPRLVQGARRHDSVWRAEWAFRFDNPKNGLGDDYVTTPSDAEVPAGISAHAANLSCIGAKESGCTVWVFWARYGQYTVYLEYISLGEGVPYARFEAHVREADKVVSRALRGTR